MSCVTDRSTFRLLDAWVGWDVASAEALVGLDDPEGLRLASVASELSPGAIAKALPPARLARGCSPCEWYLVTPCPPASRLLRISECTDGFEAVSPAKCCSGETVLRSAVAVASAGDRVAVSDPAAGSVFLFGEGGHRLLATLVFAAPGPLTHAPWGEWLVVDTGASTLRRFDRAGGERPSETPPLPGTVDRLGVDRDCRIWIVTYDAGAYAIWVTTRGGYSWRSAGLSELLEAFPDTGIERIEAALFCFAEKSPSADRHLRCYSRYGCPVEDVASKASSIPAYETAGQLLTTALDSGIPRCRWHRVRIEASVPDGTKVEVAVSTHDEETPNPKGNEADPQWQAFQPGVPHPSDWQASPRGASDFLVDQPAGRYLILRLRLSGDGRKSPVVHRIRIDFPRQTSLDALPQVYRDNAAAEDFTERFLSLFDAAIEDIDRAIERNPALLDVMGVPDEVLPWLGTFLDVAMEPSWTADERRRILQAVPDLYRRRGTVSGLSDTLRLLFEHDPLIQETALERMWGAAGSSVLGQVRLFSPQRSRFRVGRSPLSQAPLRSYGNPELDPLSTHAFRFRVFLPAVLDTGERERLTRVVNSQKPAHTVATVEGSRQGFILGAPTRVGVDTALIPLPAPVLGQPSVVLNAASVLWHGRGSAERGLRVGQVSAIGINTVME
jgi:phage tail-like protein